MSHLFTTWLKCCEFYHLVWFISLIVSYFYVWLPIFLNLFLSLPKLQPHRSRWVICNCWILSLLSSQLVSFENIAFDLKPLFISLSISLLVWFLNKVSYPRYRFVSTIYSNWCNSMMLLVFGLFVSIRYLTTKIAKINFAISVLVVIPTFVSQNADVRDKNWW